MPSGIKAFSVDLITTQQATNIYQTPIGKVAKVIVSSLFMQAGTLGGSSGIFMIGPDLFIVSAGQNKDFLISESDIDGIFYRSHLPPWEFYLPAGDSIKFQSTNSAACRSLICVIEENIS